MNTSLILTYIPRPDDDAPGADTDLSIALEQDEYPFKSPGAFEEWMAERELVPTVSNLIQAYEEYKSACTADGVLEVGLRVYLSDMTAAYSLVTSYGTVGPGELVEDTRTERVELDLADNQGVDFGTITAAEFEGDVRDDAGAIIAAPELVLDGQQVTAPQLLDGTLAITKNVSYWHHVLTLEPRDATEEQQASDDFNIGDLYAATVKLYAGGQKESVEIEMPENFGTCEGGYSIGGGARQPVEEDGEYEVVFEAFDFCTGDPIIGAEFVVDGNPVGDPSGGTVLQGGDHGVVVTASGYKSSDADDLDENDSFTLSGTEA
jgi:hypothetical protein